jgi:ferric-dicitrate binding protein FerR (iron transport regulator)
MRRENQNINNRNRLTPEAFEQEFNKLKVPVGKPKEQVWQAVFEKINCEKQAQIIPLASTFLRIAASILLVLGISSLVFFFAIGNVTVIVPRGNQVVHFLPDSSEVIINAESELSYNKNRWFLNRNVNLSGEAMFRVVKGSRFQVQTSSAKTSVLGTVFNVFSRKGITAVNCIEGRVRVVANKSKQEVILTMGDETKTKGGEMERSIKVNYSNQRVAWTQGDFYFSNAPINNVIEELERQFDVDIFIDGNTNRFYTGYFSNKSLNNALELVCLPMNLKWQVNGNMIILKENK